LLRHRFHFGCAPRRELAVDGPYRKAWINIWEYAVPENAQKWASIERMEGKPDFVTSDAVAEFLNDHKCPVEYHFLSGYHPEWIKEKSAEERAASQRRHMLETVERYKDSVDYFQVYNEFWRCPVSRAEAFVPSKEFFAELTAAYPDLKFGVSDCWRLNEPLPSEEEMLARFPGLDFIAFHAHRPRRLHVSPRVIYECFDPYASSDIKLHISEFGIREGTIQYADHLEPDWSASNRDRPDEKDGPAWTEQRKAEYFVQTIVTCFRYPPTPRSHHEIELTSARILFVPRRGRGAGSLRLEPVWASPGHRRGREQPVVHRIGEGHVRRAYARRGKE
jgi:hypothetical protein